MNGPIAFLKSYAGSDTHSILIDGNKGTGKTYLGKVYAQLLNIPDVEIILPNVQNLRESIDNCLKTENRIVLIIENLDSGTISSSNTILKFLEEPNENIYIVITVQNINKIPETILSRAVSIHLPDPQKEDLQKYAENKSARYNEIKNRKVWTAAKSLTDINTILDMTEPQLLLFDNIENILNSNENTNTIAWKLTHYDDNTDAPVKLILQYLMKSDAGTNKRFAKKINDCYTELDNKGIAKNIIISDLVLAYRYCR